MATQNMSHIIIDMKQSKVLDLKLVQVYSIVIGMLFDMYINCIHTAHLIDRVMGLREVIIWEGIMVYITTYMNFLNSRKLEVDVIVMDKDGMYFLLLSTW